MKREEQDGLVAGSRLPLITLPLKACKQMEFQDVWKFGATWEPNKVRLQQSNLEPCMQCDETGLVTCKRGTGRDKYPSEPDPCSQQRVLPSRSWSWAKDSEKVIVNCLTCNGTGISKTKCENCDGEGEVQCDGFCDEPDCQGTHDCLECIGGLYSCDECKHFRLFNRRKDELGTDFIGLGKIVKHKCGLCHGSGEFDRYEKTSATWEPHKVRMLPSLGLEPCKRCIDAYSGEPTGLVVCRKTYNHQDDRCNVPIKRKGDISSEPWAADTKQVIVDCSACNGTGRSDDDCPDCYGEGLWQCEDGDCDEGTHDCEECFNGKQYCSECKNFANFSEQEPNNQMGFRFVGFGKMVMHKCGACQGTLESKTAATWEPHKVRNRPFASSTEYEVHRSDDGRDPLFPKNRDVSELKKMMSEYRVSPKTLLEYVRDNDDINWLGLHVHGDRIYVYTHPEKILQTEDFQEMFRHSVSMPDYGKMSLRIKEDATDPGKAKMSLNHCNGCQCKEGDTYPCAFNATILVAKKLSATWEPHKVRMLPQEELKSYEVSNEFRNHRLSGGMQYLFPKGRDMSDFIDTETISGWLGYVANNEDLNWLGIINHRNKRMYVYADTSLDKTDLDEMFRNSVVFKDDKDKDDDYGDKDDVGIYSIYLSRRNQRDSYINHASECQCANGDTSPCSDTAFQRMTDGTQRHLEFAFWSNLGD